MGEEKERYAKPKGIKKWIEHFWYYYKFYAIVAVVLAVSVATGIAQCASKPKYDYRLVISTASAQLSTAQINALQNKLLQYADDYNKDGSINVRLINCTYNEGKSDYNIVMAQKQKLQSILMNENDVLLFITDQKSYEWINSIRKDGFMEDLSLSKEDPRRFELTNSQFYASAKQDAPKEWVWPEKLYISQRIVSGTLIENKPETKDELSKNQNFLNKLIEQNK